MVIAITGGTRGIGRAVAERLAEAGHDLLLGYRADAEAAEEALQALRHTGASVIAHAVDVTDADALARFLSRAQELGPLTAVVANAGSVSAVGPLQSLDPEQLRRDLDTNLLGAVLTARAAIPVLSAATDAGASPAIVFIGSAAATLGSPHSYVHYAAAKAGVAALTVGLSKELAPLGIRVNCVEPGTVWTEFHEDPERPALVANSVPLGRAGQPAEIAGAVSWFLSADAGYATGAVLRVAGGL